MSEKETGDATCMELLEDLREMESRLEIMAGNPRVEKFAAGDGVDVALDGIHIAMEDMREAIGDNEV